MTAIGPTPIAIAVVQHNGCVLIGTRGRDVPLAGLWEFPGGKVEPGETPEQAAIRECREEAALAVEVRQLLSEVVHSYSHGQVRLLFFDCRPIDPCAIPSTPFRWVSRRDLPQYEFPSANAAVVQWLACTEDEQHSG